uniref:Glycerol kinase 5 n=1 Tax=Cairina moschata TaxID=8855 RepID=A0A8C3BFP1_CAIMO
MPCGQPESGGAAAPARYVLGVDVGSTAVKCHVYDRAAAVRGSSCRKVESLYPHPGWVELDPEVLWSQFIGVIKEAVQAVCPVQSHPSFHRVVSCPELKTNCFILKQVIHVIFTMLHFLTGNDRYLAPSFLTFSTHQTSMKLSWVFKNIPEADEAAKKNNCCFGTVDTWLLYKLTKGSVYATDYSNASSTGIFEPFTVCAIEKKLCCYLILLFPQHIFSDTSNSSEVHPTCWCIWLAWQVADQQSAMFGECCFLPGDVKLTMGTGGFWNINTGGNLYASKRDLYPLIGWKIGDEVVYITEGCMSDTGNAIKWAQDINLFTNVDETAEMARSIVDSQGVCFVPGFQVSANDPYLCASFMGLKPTTSRSHLVRAILESVAFRNKQLYDIIVKKVHIPLQTVRADGGVSNNSFVMQMTSDLINKKIEKPANTDMSSLGAAFLAGLASGLWTDKEQLKKLRRIEAVFEPQKDLEEYRPAMDTWMQAVKRSLHW